jgi:hypothetical protein
MEILPDKLILTNALLCPIIPVFEFAPFGEKEGESGSKGQAGLFHECGGVSH